MNSQLVLDVAELRSAAASGLMALTGQPDGPPLAPPPGLVRGMDSLTAAIGWWSAEAGTKVDLRWEPLLTGHAALLGLGRQGRRSPNGSCRLLRAGDGWVAINLARPEDVGAVNAIVARDSGETPWEALEVAAARMSRTQFVSRVRLLGVPAATLRAPCDRPPSVTGSAAAWTSRRLWPAIRTPELDALRVVDLSSMWAGPLTAMILARAGAVVTKVESTARPDGARDIPAFYRSLHPPGQPELLLDLAQAAGRRRLRSLLDRADVVIESSRPRALEQLGAGPMDVAARPGRVWVSITGYGREAPGRDWVAFGDDAAVAGGLVSWESADRPVFCGDAIADPLTGLTAASAALEALCAGGGVLLDVAMSRAASFLVGGNPKPQHPSIRAMPSPGGGWHVDVGGSAVAVRDPEVGVA